MAAINVGLSYESKPFALTGTGETDVYTVGDDGESWIDLAGVLVTDPGSVSTAVRIRWFDLSANTSYTLVPASMALPSATENLEFICEPTIRMRVGDEVRVTGASGHHVITTFAKGGTTPGAAAQR